MKLEWKKQGSNGIPGIRRMREFQNLGGKQHPSGQGTTSLALLWLLVLPHHNLPMGSSVLCGTKEEKKRGKRTQEDNKSSRKPSGCCPVQRMIQRCVSTGRGVWCPPERSSRDGAWRGERGGSAFWGEHFGVLFPANSWPWTLPWAPAAVAEVSMSSPETWWGGTWCAQLPPSTGRAESSPTITPLTVNISETFTWYFFLSI